VATAISVTDLPAASAKGSLTYGGAAAELKFAAAFVDQKDQCGPIGLVISDQKLPVEKWESKGSHFFLLTSLRAPTRHAEVQTVGGSLVRRTLLSVFCLLSSVFCLLSSVFCLLSSVLWPLAIVRSGMIDIFYRLCSPSG
jgi:hypothetical protein